MGRAWLAGHHGHRQRPMQDGQGLREDRSRFLRRRNPRHRHAEIPPGIVNQRKAWPAGPQGAPGAGGDFRADPGGLTHGQD